MSSRLSLLWWKLPLVAIVIVSLPLILMPLVKYFVHHPNYKRNIWRVEHINVCYKNHIRIVGAITQDFQSISIFRIPFDTKTSHEYLLLLLLELAGLTTIFRADFTCFHWITLDIYINYLRYYRWFEFFKCCWNIEDGTISSHGDHLFRHETVECQFTSENVRRQNDRKTPIFFYKKKFGELLNKTIEIIQINSKSNGNERSPGKSFFFEFD